MKFNMPKSILFILIIFVVCANDSFGQITAQDSLGNKAIERVMADSLAKTKPATIDSTNKKTYKISPKLATKRSAMIPGWGQVYSKHYWTIPIIYGGFAASTAGILYNAKRYQILKKAYFAASDANKLNANVTSGKFTLNNQEIELSIANLKQYTSYFRRYRDISWLSIPVVWAVNILEVNVATHLKTFDMSDDITMKLEPSFAPNPFNGLPTLGGKMVFALK